MEGEKRLSSVKNVLLIRNGALGDFIVTLPVLTCLKKSFPQARITVMANPYYLPLIKNQVDVLLPNDIPGLHTLYTYAEDFPETVKRLFPKFDLVISYSPDPNGCFANNLKRLGVPWVIKGSPFPTQPIFSSITEFLLTPLKAEGISTRWDPPNILPTREDQKFAQEFFQSTLNYHDENKEIIAIHPGSGNAKKCWPVKKFVELIKWIKNDFKAKVLLIVGPAENRLKEQIKKLSEENDLFIVRNFPLNHLAAILQKCQVYLGNDSGITHLAAAVGVPTLAIFGPTDFRVWGPKNKKVKFLSSFYTCAPCVPEKMAKCEHLFCLESLTVDKVKKSFLNLYFQFCSSFLPINYTNLIKERGNYVSR